jgi:hypothetical protein
MSQRYVIMRGQVFRWEEKEPFVSSGKSILGALEYDRDADALRCHVCGGWYRRLGNHIANREDHPDTQAYRLEHGIRRTTGLWSPGLRQLAREQARAELSKSNGFSVITAEQRHNAIARAAMTQRRGIPKHESRNERGRCDAQLRAKILSLAPVSAADGMAARSRMGGVTALRPRRYRGVTFTEPILRELLIDFYVLNRRLPHARDWGKGSLPSQGCYGKMYGGMKAAYEAAGLGLIAAKEPARLRSPRKHTAAMDLVSLAGD